VTLRVLDSAGRTRARHVGRRCPECGEWAPEQEREWAEHLCPTCLTDLDELPDTEPRWLVVVNEEGSAV
jgi:hypothetical protein